MYQIAVSLLSVFLLVNFCHVQDLYDMKVDELFSTMIGPIYKIKKTTHDFIRKYSELSTTKSTPVIKLRFINEPDAPGGSTERNDYYVTRHKRRMKARRSLAKSDIDVEKLVGDSEEKPIPDFTVDPFKVLSRRFDHVRNFYTAFRAKQALREEYFQFEYTDLVKMEKKRVLSIMEQFVYESRYKLIYAQRLRKKYKRKVAYQLGYCFALMRNMKQQQLVILSAMHTNRLNYTTFYHFTKMYERVIRLDIDLKDLISFIKYLDLMMSMHNETVRPHRRNFVPLKDLSKQKFSENRVTLIRNINTSRFKGRKAGNTAFEKKKLKKNLNNSTL